MNKLLKSALVVGCISLISCGGGGGGGFSEDVYVKLNSLKVEDQFDNETQIIYPGEVFYIKWDVDYKNPNTPQGYNISFYLLPDDNVPDFEEEDYIFYREGCGTVLSDCSKGIRCVYEKSEGEVPDYRIGCSSYSTLYEDWMEIRRKISIDPYQINYLGANAYVIYMDSELNLRGKQSKKALPITFMP